MAIFTTQWGRKKSKKNLDDSLLFFNSNIENETFSASENVVQKMKT